MIKKTNLAFGPGIVVRGVVFRERWFVSADGAGARSCPDCAGASVSPHRWHVRRLQDRPIQGAPVVLELRLGRWRCLNEACERKTFVERVTTAFPLRDVRIHLNIRNSQFVVALDTLLGLPHFLLRP
jgi:hypothetical protein